MKTEENNDERFSLSQFEEMQSRIAKLEKENKILKEELDSGNNNDNVITVLDNIPLALVNLDLEGNILFGNAFYYSLFDIDPNYNKSTDSIFNLSQIWGTNMLDSISQLVNDKKSFDIETELKHPGQKRIYKTRGLCIKNEEGTINSYLIIIGDVTVRKKAEHELISARDRAEESDKLKTAFISNISHEIRTPINHILGFLELLAMDNLELDTKKEYRDIIYRSSQALLNSIDNIIDIARIKSGQIKLKKSEININDLFNSVHSIIPDLQTKNGGRQLEIIKRIPQNSENLSICTDANRLKQIMVNLVENAIKFTHEGRVEFGYKIINNNSLNFFVKDTGIGIKEGDFDLIFENFRQVDYKNTREVEGSGLGLSISKGLADLLDAQIDVKSVVGKGSVFYLHFPNIKIDLKDNNTNPQPEIFDTGF